MGNLFYGPTQRSKLCAGVLTNSYKSDFRRTNRIPERTCVYTILLFNALSPNSTTSLKIILQVVLGTTTILRGYRKILVRWGTKEIKNNTRKTSI